MQRWLRRIFSVAGVGSSQFTQEMKKLRMRLLLARPIFQARVQSCGVILTFLREISGRGNQVVKAVALFIRLGHCTLFYFWGDFVD